MLEILGLECDRVSEISGGDDVDIDGEFIVAAWYRAPIGSRGSLMGGWKSPAC